MFLLVCHFEQNHWKLLFLSSQKLFCWYLNDGEEEGYEDAIYQVLALYRRSTSPVLPCYIVFICLTGQSQDHSFNMSLEDNFHLFICTPSSYLFFGHENGILLGNV